MYILHQTEVSGSPGHMHRFSRAHAPYARQLASIIPLTLIWASVPSLLEWMRSHGFTYRLYTY